MDFARLLVAVHAILIAVNLHRSIHVSTFISEVVAPYSGFAWHKPFRKALF
jgi:hypothetical protein